MAKKKPEPPVTAYIKSARPSIGQVKLDINQLIFNKLNDIETTLILDTNVVIAMERVVNGGNKWASVKAQGLEPMVKLLQQSPVKSVALSVGNALYEMPPAKAEAARIRYERFCSVHLPHFCDTPTAIQTKFDGAKGAYQYSDLSRMAQAVFALPYISLLYLNLVYHLKSRRSPIDKFKDYLDLLQYDFDFISSTEVEIAKYCFAEPEHEHGELFRLRNRIRNNFVGNQDLKSSEEIKHLAFNGAHDIHMLQCANSSDARGLEGVPQDTWIATQDTKLADFCEIFHHVNDDGDAGKVSAFAVLPEHANDVYWLLAETEFFVRNVTRRAYAQQRGLNLDSYVDYAFKLERRIEEVFPNVI